MCDIYIACLTYRRRREVAQTNSQPGNGNRQRVWFIEVILSRPCKLNERITITKIV